MWQLGRDLFRWVGLLLTETGMASRCCSLLLSPSGSGLFWSSGVMWLATWSAELGSSVPLGWQGGSRSSDLQTAAFRDLEASACKITATTDLQTLQYMRIDRTFTFAFTHLYDCKLRCSRCRSADNQIYVAKEQITKTDEDAHTLLHYKAFYIQVHPAR